MTPDISISTKEWAVVGREVPVQLAAGGSADTLTPYNRVAAYDMSVVDAVSERALVEDTTFQSTPLLGNARAGSREQIRVDPSMTITIAIKLNEMVSQSNVLLRYRSLINSLPAVKRATLIKALSRINAYLLDLEFSDDGEIIIQTRENDRDCFYAICTEEGDFKGTWLPDGSLTRQSWSANPPYEYIALNLI